MRELENENGGYDRFRVEGDRLLELPHREQLVPLLLELVRRCRHPSLRTHFCTYYFQLDILIESDALKPIPETSISQDSRRSRLLSIITLTIVLQIHD